jgi:putative membrane protein
MLIWGIAASGATAFQFKVLGLACVIAAGLYGTFTSSKRIFFVQVVPAALALVLVLLAVNAS